MKPEDFSGEVGRHQRQVEEEERAKLKAINKALPPDLSKRCIIRPHKAKPGVTFNLAEGRYQVGAEGNMVRLNPKSSRKQKHREEVQARKAERERKRRVG